MDDWWPDWRGETVVIVASGPSQRRSDVTFARHRARVITINTSWLLCPDADVHYASDRGWWEHEGHGYGQHCLRDGRGVKVSARNVPGTVTVDAGAGNSALRGMRLAAIFGAARIVLTGVDCRGKQWHGSHPAPLGQQRHATHGAWVDEFEDAVPWFDGVEVINASRASALDCFPRMALADAL